MNWKFLAALGFASVIALSTIGNAEAQAVSRRGYHCKIILKPDGSGKPFEVMGRTLGFYYTQQNFARYGTGMLFNKKYNVPGITDTFTGRIANNLAEGQRLCDQMGGVLLAKAKNATMTARATLYVFP